MGEQRSRMGGDGTSTIKGDCGELAGLPPTGIDYVPFRSPPTPLHAVG